MRWFADKYPEVKLKTLLWLRFKRKRNLFFQNRSYNNESKNEKYFGFFYSCF
jgi:hypothetical protein